MPDTTSTIRLLSPEDSGDFRTIRLTALQLAPQAFGSNYEAERSLLSEHWAERLGTSSIFGAYRGGIIVGMAGFARQTALKYKHKGSIWGVFVQPDARGQNIGFSLMDAVLDLAFTHVHQVTLTVTSENQSAVSLHEKCGFVPYGTEPRALYVDGNYLDEIMMVRFKT